MTLDALADACGVSRPTVIDWEKGVGPGPRIASIPGVCAVLGISPHWLIYGREPDHAALDAEQALHEAALADVRQRCGGYPDSRVDGDGGIVAVVVRERDEARAKLATARAQSISMTDDGARIIAAAIRGDLPVLSACGGCAHFDGDSQRERGGGWCTLRGSRNMSRNMGWMTNETDKPPTWCPLRSTRSASLGSASLGEEFEK